MKFYLIALTILFILTIFSLLMYLQLQSNAEDFVEIYKPAGSAGVVEQGSQSIASNEALETTPNPTLAEEFIAEISAYTSSVSETDDSPCIAASGWNICLNEYSAVELCGEFICSRFYDIIACPARYEFRTIVEIDGKRYVCLDVMGKAKRYGNFFDLYMGQGEEAYDKAMQWGRRELLVRILE